MMKRSNFKTWFWIAAGIGLVALASPLRAWAHGPADGGANTDAVDGLFRIVLLIAIPIFLVVEGLIIYSVFRYRRRDKDEMPEQVEGNMPLEISWTVLSFVIVAVLFILTLRALQTDYEVEAENGEGNPDLTVEVFGYLFNWDYHYYLEDGTDTGVTTTKTLYIPADRAVLLEITSRDVQHSFWVPELAGKVDAVPGYSNSMWLRVDEPGTYEGNCAEYCGLNHYNMLIEVEVMEPTAFNAWLDERMAEAGQSQMIGTDLETPLPAGDPENGEQVFNGLACNACHLPEDDQPSGPSLARMMDEAAAVEGYTADEYLRESILLPCEQLAEGWDQCIMSQNYGERLTPQELADLIEYIKTY